MANMDLKAIITAEDRTGGAFSSFHNSLKTATVAIGAMAVAAGGLLVAGLVSCVKEASNAEFVQAKFTQALKQSAKATNEQVKELNDYAEALQFQVGIADEEIKNGIAMLATFKLTTAQIKKATPALIDMAAAYKKNTGEAIDLQQTAIMIGKATGGELYKNLQRVGVIFDENQLKMLENADAAERLRIVTEELGNEFGGQALAQANTFSGKMAILGLYIDDFKEKVGMAILNALNPFIERLMTWARSPEAQIAIQNITDKVGGMAAKMVEWITNVAIPWVQTHWPAIKRVADEVYGAISGFIGILGELITKCGDQNSGVIWKLGLVAGALALLTPAGGWVITLVVAAAAYQDTMNKIAEAKKAMDGFPTYKKIQFVIEGINDTVQQLIPNFGSKLANWLFGKAGGGFVAGNTPYLVGEKGPEVFMPNSSGRIIPNNQLGGNQITVNFYGDLNNQGMTVSEAGQSVARQIELALRGAK